MQDTSKEIDPRCVGDVELASRLQREEDAGNARPRKRQASPCFDEESEEESGAEDLSQGTRRRAEVAEFAKDMASKLTARSEEREAGRVRVRGMRSNMMAAMEFGLRDREERPSYVEAESDDGSGDEGDEEYDESQDLNEIA